MEVVVIIIIIITITIFMIIIINNTTIDIIIIIIIITIIIIIIVIIIIIDATSLSPFIPPALIILSCGELCISKDSPHLPNISVWSSLGVTLLAWPRPAHAAVQIAHGADLGMDTLALGRVPR